MTNVNLASAGPAKTSETGALRGTGQNLGNALGTAIIGSLLLGLLTRTFNHRVERDTALPYQPHHEVATKTRRGLALLPAEVAGRRCGRSTFQSRSSLSSKYSQSEVDALKIAVGGVAALALLGLSVTRPLPSHPLRTPPRRLSAPDRDASQHEQAQADLTSCECGLRDARFTDTS